MTTLPLPRLAALLTDNARGVIDAEAATRLLVGHGTWLGRRDFLAACVDLWDTDGEFVYGAWRPGTDVDPDRIAAASVIWEDIPGFAEAAPCSGSEGRVLRLVAELAGYDTGVPLGELLSGLDDRNSRLVVDAVAHALRVPVTPPEAGR